MRCPFCKTKLVEGQYKEYETLAEHVFNPNQENYPKRKTFVCPAVCDNSLDSFWDEWGDWYTSRITPKIAGVETSAIGSGARKSHNSIEREKKWWYKMLFIKQIRYRYWSIRAWWGNSPYYQQQKKFKKELKDAERKRKEAAIA